MIKPAISPAVTTRIKPNSLYSIHFDEEKALNKTITVNIDKFIKVFNFILSLKIFIEIRTCIIEETNCVISPEYAAPNAPNFGIRNIFKITFRTKENAAVRFNSFKFPFAVRSVPKI